MTCSTNKNLIKNDTEKCPKCGSNHIKSISRITGYLGFDERFNESKVCERSDRVDHINGNKQYC